MKKYDSYKRVDSHWFNECPTHWKITKLKFEVSIKNGYAFKSEEFIDSGIPVIRIGDLKPPFVDTSGAKCVMEDRLNTISDFLVTEGDILIAMTGATIGKTALYNSKKPALLNQRVGQLNALTTNSQHFLNHLLNSNSFEDYIQLQCGGSAQENIGKNELNEFTVCLPALKEQTQIANYLDHKTSQIDDLISKKERLIELLKEERTATINQAVTKGLDPNVPMKDSGIEWLGEIPEHWEVKRLKDLMCFGTGLSITKKNLKEKGIPCVNYGEIHSKFGVNLDTTIHTLKCVDKEYLEKSSKAIIQKGDFIFADTSEDVDGAGNFTHLRNDDEIFAGYHTVTVKPKKELSSTFFSFEFDSLNFRRQVRQSIKGVKVFSVTQSILKNTKIWLPSIKEQIQIATYLDFKTSQIDDLIRKIEKEIELLKEYKTALISEVVTGKVDVRGGGI